MTGTVPSALFNLPIINELALYFSGFSGPLPSTISPSIQSLYLSSCSFCGSLPKNWVYSQFSGAFEIDNNQFSGPIPASLVASALPTCLIGGTNNFACPSSGVSLAILLPTCTTSPCGGIATPCPGSIIPKGGKGHVPYAILHPQNTYSDRDKRIIIGVTISCGTLFILVVIFLIYWIWSGDGPGGVLPDWPLASVDHPRPAGTRDA